jgi:integrase
LILYSNGCINSFHAVPPYLNSSGGTNGGTQLKGEWQAEMGKLTVKAISGLKARGKYSDGNGLYVRVGPTGGKSWILRTVVHGVRKELGLGSVSLVTLAEARDLAHKYRKIAREGGNPDTVRKRESLTFSDAAQRVHKILLPTWRNDKHAATWLTSLETYAHPHFGQMPLHTISSAEVLKALTPIWTAKHDTAKRLKQRIAAVFDWAKSAGHYSSENPVNGINKALPVIKTQNNHFVSLDWREVPAIMMALSKRDGISARSLELIILTASRSGEVRGARWDEIGGNVWTIPGERMKRGVQHRIPLTTEALAILERVKGLDGDLVFPSVQRAKNGTGKEQSNMVYKSLLKRMGRDEFTIHGFRSSFRDWCSESAMVDREVAEAALSHATGNSVERAYARSDLFERRAELMNAWARYATGQSGDVVELVRA